MSTRTVFNRLTNSYRVGTSTVFRPNVPDLTNSYVVNKGPDILYSFTRTTTPDNIPGYRDLIRRGLPASTLLSGSRVSFRPHPASILQYSHSSLNPNLVQLVGFDGWTFLGTSYSLPSFSDESLRIRALQQFLSSYQSNIRQFSGGVFLGEIKETLALLVRPGKIVRKSLDAYYSRAKKVRKRASRGRGSLKSRARNAARALSNEWLTYKFGISPLLQDISDASHALAEISANRRLQQRINGVSSARNYSPRSVVRTLTQSSLRFDVYELSEQELTYHYHGSMWLDTGSPTQVINSLGFAPQEWLPTAWELIPYSFVIDYFTNIGDLISAWSYGTFQLNWSLLTVRGFRRVVRDVGNLRSSDPLMVIDSYSNGNPSVAVTSTRIDRSINPNLVPSFQLKFPGLGSQRWINLAALVAQRGRDASFRL